MSPEERQLLAGLFDRIRNASAQPRDREAETFINDAVRTQPYAPYLLAQTVIVQDQALRAANDRLQELEGRLQELEQQGTKPQGGFLGGLFGGGGVSSAAPRPGVSSQSGPWGGAPAPQQGGWAGQPQGGPSQGGWGQAQPGYGQQGFGQQGAPGGGGGFLKGALGAAAGVAGGVLLADSIKGLFHGGNNSLGIGSGFGGGSAGLGGGETVVNNYYGDSNTDDGGYASSGGDDATISDADYASDGGSDDDGGGYA